VDEVEERNVLCKLIHVIGNEPSARLRHPPQWHTSYSTLSLLFVIFQSLKIIARNK
jgi:hypothetical protein